MLHAPEQSPLQPVVNTMVRQAAPLQPMELKGGADIHLQPVEDHTREQVDAPKAGSELVGRPQWSPQAPGRNCDLVGDPNWSSLLLKNCTLWKDSCWRSSWMIVSCGRDPTLEQGKSVKNLSPEEEGAAETACDELIAAPIPCPPVLAGGRR
ncbi:hypothetical protein llap_7510 [Limosa lapponica baueri]|uniref:Uncharacterized protein n=1 Tax=Limosa lapponica baueri TaxID=1758121 RepID=A0A2I0U824_LIMLA|nr:hypothetical protein llap_7510 [Limosa lapponica baueri]